MYGGVEKDKAESEVGYLVPRSFKRGRDARQPGQRGTSEAEAAPVDQKRRYSAALRRTSTSTQVLTSLEWTVFDALRYDVFLWGG